MEQEYKWKWPKDAQAAALLEFKTVQAHELGRERVQMRAVYYDTPSGLFFSKNGALRFRQENEKGVVCIKLQTGEQGACAKREEYEMEADEVLTGLHSLPDHGAPLELCRSAEAEGIVELCRTEFIRIAVTLRIPGGDEGDCTAELAADHGLAKREGRMAPIQELELEYKEGDTETFHKFAHRLEEVYDLKAQKKSKVAQAMSV